MTQEEKQLLLIDLCARLPYGLICKELGQAKKLLSVSPSKAYGITLDNGEYTRGNYKIGDIKPYLRPMSSITEEEEKEFEETLQYTQYTLESYDWLNAHHFDYRGLIKKGLALEAPENMYK